MKKLVFFLFLMLFTSLSFCMEEELYIPQDRIYETLKHDAEQDVSSGKISKEDYEDRLKFLATYFLSNEEYAYFMRLIQQINPMAYKTLNECARKNNQRCLKIAGLLEQSQVIPGSKETYGYPTMMMDSRIKFLDEEHQKELLRSWLDIYNQFMTHEERGWVSEVMTSEEREWILEVIKYLDVNLYNEIIKVDRTGIDHVKRSYDHPINASVSISSTDGLPVFWVGAGIKDLPLGEQLAILGHELGHYVLGHALEKHVYTVAPLFGKPFELAYSRNQEFEADKFAVLDLGISIDDVIANMQRIKGIREGIIRATKKKGSTFESTHPPEEARIKQLEDLRREVELIKRRYSRYTPRPQIKWRQLADEYLQKLYGISR
jgi:hypothetical protein